LTFGAFTGGFFSFIIEPATRKFINRYHLWKIDLNLKAPRTAGTMRKASLKNITAKCPRNEEDGNGALQDCLKAIENYFTAEPKKNVLKEAAKHY
jgi:hypothetical protein